MFTQAIRELIEAAIKRHENKDSLGKLRKEATENKIDWANRFIIDVYPDHLAEAQNKLCEYNYDLKIYDEVDRIAKSVNEVSQKTATKLIEEIANELDIPKGQLGAVICNHEQDNRFTKPFYPSRYRVLMPEKFINDLKESFNPKMIKMNPVGSTYKVRN